MAFSCFRDFVEALESAGELRRIRGILWPRSLRSRTRRPRNEVAGRRQGPPDRKADSQRPGESFPVAINTMGSWKRMAIEYWERARSTRSPQSLARC